MKILRAARLGSNFTGSYKKRVYTIYSLSHWWKDYSNRNRSLFVVFFATLYYD